MVATNIVKPLQWWDYNREDPIADGLVCLLPISRGMGLEAIDVSGNGNHGTLTGGPTWVGSEIGLALDFDGNDDRVSIPSSTTLDITGDHTLLAWVCPRDITTRGGIIDKLNPDSPYNGYTFIHSRLGDAALTYYNSNTSWKYSTALVVLNKWQMVAVAVDVDVGGIFYLDGAAAGSWSDSSSAPPSYSGPMLIGEDYTGANLNSLYGLVAIWNRALSVSEIERLYLNPDILTAPPDTWAMWMAAVLAAARAAVTGGTTGLADRLTADAEMFVATFGETVVYTPLGGEGRNILAVVDRHPAAGGPGGRVAVPRIAVGACNRQTAISDDEVGGIGSAEVNTGGDTVTLARRLKKAAETLQLTRVIGHDEGMMHVEIG